MSELGGIVLLTLRAASAGTLLILVPGVLLAWALSRRGWRGRSVLEALVALPLVLPPTAVGFALLLLLRRDGVLGTALHRLGWDVPFTGRALVLASAVMSLPLLVRSARTALEDVDPRLVGIARTLGRSRSRAFLEVELPLAWRGILAGAVLAFTRGLGEFGATVVLAGNIPGKTQTIALALFRDVQLGHDRSALGLAALAAGLSLAAVALSEWLVRRRERWLEA